MKFTITILLFLIGDSIVYSQNGSSGYVLSRPDGTPILKAASIDDSLLKNDKQNTLVSGTNIKTINGTSLLGSGNIVINAGGEAFPIGSVFLSVVSTNPATLLGYGTWEAIAAGQMLVGFNAGDTDFDAAEKTGGFKTRTITADNIPQLSVSITDPGHTHVQNKNTATNGPLSGATPDASTNTSAASDYSTASATTGITATANTGSVNTALNILNPYFTVYIWKRTN